MMPFPSEDATPPVTNIYLVFIYPIYSNRDTNITHFLYLCSELILKDMNLRDIKKDIAYILEAFIEDCTTVATVNAKVDEQAAELFEEAVNLYNELMDKVSAKIEGSKKAYYIALRKELLEKTDELYAKLSEIVKKATNAE